MRRSARLGSALLAIVATGAVADAKVVREPQADPNRSELWRNVVEPHADEIAAILRRVHEDFNNAENVAMNDYDPTGARRLVSLTDAYGALRYARRLSPQNLDVLALLGNAADALGNTRQAIEAYQAYLQLAEPKQTDGEVAGRLGIIYLRMGQLDDAIRYLRLGERPMMSSMAGAQIEVALATALAQRGQMADGIDALVAAVPAGISYYANYMVLATFALAVMYDRDEQRSNAFDTLDHMQTAMSGSFGNEVQAVLQQTRFVPAEDAHYYTALLYEASNLYPEARAEWAMYAAIPDAPWRGRALEHVAQLDALRRAQKPVDPIVPSLLPPPSSWRPPKLTHRRPPGAKP